MWNTLLERLVILTIHGVTSQCLGKLKLLLRGLFYWGRKVSIDWIISDFLVFFYWKKYMCIWEKAMAPHSSTLAWKIPWMEEPDGLPSMGSHRVGHDWSDLAAAAAARNYENCLSKPIVSCKWRDIQISDVSSVRLLESASTELCEWKLREISPWLWSLGLINYLAPTVKAEALAAVARDL